MTLAATTDLIASATAARSAVLAFNVITIEHAEGIAAGAEHAGTAVIMQISENTVRFHGGRIAPVAMACARIAEGSVVPIALHLDHFRDTALLGEAIASAAALGVTSIMVDAAQLPYQDNVDRTRSFATAAHQAGLWVEAELGEIGGKGDAHASGARTDPEEAAVFAEQTGVDGLAVAVGSTHAMTVRDASLDLALIHELAQRVPIPLVLHGSSGVPDSQLRQAVNTGIRKINIGTALNVALTGAVRDVLAADAVVTDPRSYLKAGRQAIGDTVAELCRAVGSPRQAVIAGEAQAR
ncbi:fructose-bisphosphate aldolase [Mycobacterium sp. 852013-50091_SCH5140682]|uniref:class II fructose-bisphosphate aldolase n=1 Tax=Mycobacterium sp. 852013-50091_SCH5140682 TaxID=1834109 RepID=UPI0007EBFEC7|nr:class II fructose-bisphosphate aldolase [Mycobacterium sp. 852013-50091_SCH5140682]OBC17076.1 fructose-bisphosphate aldolase [Mycobacterium sp. 852013-50091_SCH5140682]